MLSTFGAAAQPAFLEVASERGFLAYDMMPRGFGAGAAAADFDDDGDVDVFLPTAHGTPHQLYRNLGDGNFEEAAGPLGLAETDSGRAALWFDFDGDGRLDLLVNTDCFEVSCTGAPSALRLYRQGSGGSFTEVTEAAGLSGAPAATEQHRSGLAAADLNGDGFLDFVTGFWMGPLKLYLNGGDGTFADVSAAAGIDDAPLGYHQPLLQDFNGDGRMDIFATVDFTENRLWLQQAVVAGVPIFSEVAQAAGCDNAMNDMGVSLGDFDEDGKPDLYITNIFRDGLHNVLLRQMDGGGLAFEEVSGAAGVQDGGWGWGTTFLDVDNDRWLDLAETNGWRTNNWLHPPRLYMHQGDTPATFVDGAALAGLTDTSWGTTLLAFDYDRDGDLDLLETISEVGGRPDDEEVRLHENQLNRTVGGRHYLVVRPRMPLPNSRAIGARIRVEAAGRTMSRWITAGTSYLGQEPAEAFFGLGDAGTVDRITVSWPGGGETVLESVAVDQVMTVDYTPFFADGFESGDTSSWSSTVP